MTCPIAAPVLELRPDELTEAGWASAPCATTAERAAASPDRFLAPDHPFLREGTWRAFVAREGSASVRVVASLDPRQRVDGAAIGSVGFVALRGDVRAARRPLRAALAAAEAWLSANRAAVVRCPVQFSTWFGHRVMTHGLPAAGGPPLFPMEPPPTPHLASVLETRGYGVAHTAGSYRVDVGRWIAGTRRGEDRLRASGFRDRPVDVERLDDELRAVHAISVASFTASWGFAPIGFAEFASIYRPLLALLDPGFVRILDTPGGEPVGFVFAFPDGRTDGDAAPRFVVKTAAVLPEVRRAVPGVGMGLTVAVHRLAVARGCRVALHACVADGAYSQRVSARWGDRIRTYATYEKVLR